MVPTESMRSENVQATPTATDAPRTSWKGRAVHFVTVDLKNGIKDLKIGDRLQKLVAKVDEFVSSPRADLLAHLACTTVAHTLGFSINVLGLCQLFLAPFPSSLMGIPTIMLGLSINAAAARVNEKAFIRFRMAERGYFPLWGKSKPASLKVDTSAAE